MDGWSTFIHVVVPAYGALLFLMFVADEMESTAQKLNSIRGREEKLYQKRLKAQSPIITAEKVA